MWIHRLGAFLSILDRKGGEVYDKKRKLFICNNSNPFIHSDYTSL